MNGTNLAGAPVQPVVEIRHLNKSFGGLKVTDDVSLSLRPGIVTTLVGPNGAGKTTLFNQITGHLVPDSGEILLNGEVLGREAHWKIARRGVGRTFQDLRLFDHMTVEENVLTVMEPSAWLWQSGGGARKRQRQDRVSDILEATRLLNKAKTRAIDLSYAERKFLSMARVMATDSQLWLLDEPASGLDRSSYELFLELLRSQTRMGITVCIIEHNLDIVIGISDRIAFLDRGKLLADGEPAKVLADPHLAAIYFGEQTA
ncbi:Lipopolysaccharide export system ATP-binding protein LptB [Variovorax sp. PBL-H6]|uniref:ABC transporter ATP-binding protein n=1 Tax=Variovorax sp. PBL-H6 TaxID=434009 RepID=UPI001318FACA|nr:ABC transporter ATP-binding protein [Variovorax sp. PBL-H6]VTU26222.1 Lipopolysaccharide export system ATP-binding protein LptB [Variovorax sp. PBL-H6]